jgi:transcriptional regulator with XRE-family HTH domain
MGVKDWIKQAEKNGWRVRSVNSLTISLKCSKQGCPGCVDVPLNNLGAVPDPCDLPHRKHYAARTFKAYEDLVEQLIRRRRSLGLSQEDVCAAAALADGHISKLEAFHRIGQLPTLQLWADTLGMSLTLAPAPLPNATIRAIENRPAPLQHRPPKPRQKSLFDDKQDPS